MLLIVRFLFGAITALLLMASAAHAESRLALVIGNGAYANLPETQQLPSPVRDASDIAATLRDIGFEVIEGNSSNLSLQDMLDRIEALAAAVKPGDTVLFYFSGHGIALDTGNYFLPSDIPALRPGQDQRLIQASLSEATVIQMMQAKGAGGVILIIDACRNNPLAKAGGKGVGEAAGLIPRSPVKGVFSLYAAGQGQIALDRLSGDDTDPNSLFTRALIPLLKTKGLTQTALAKEVQTTVERLASEVGHEQFPAYYDQVRGVFSFNPDNADCGGVLLASTGGAAKCLKPGDEFTDCDGCPAMVVIPAGSFTMGSPQSEEGRSDNEGPQHMVTIGQPFAVGRFEVTRGQFAAFVADSGHAAGDACWTYEESNGLERSGRSFRKVGFEQTDDHPAVCVNWNDAQAYVKWLKQKTGATYRLLSEAEWEYAARAGSTTRFSFGDADAGLCDVGNGADKTALAKFKDWIGYNNCADGYVYTALAGTYTANEFGLHDMLGNVWEWVEDCYEDSYRGAPDDGTARRDQSGCNRVSRGGSWGSFPLSLRSAFRFLDTPDFRGNSLGFRVARTL